ncbi:MAG: glucose 1-dehydrogenase [Deltaproteobacteria bacterium]|nr:glucose 1-dehydrogenase [Deltaproteobacteria bacterium]
MAGRLDGKVALISGAARGQGETEARMFVKEGAAVVLGDILVAEGERVAASIRAAGGQAQFVKLDVTQEGDWQQSVAQAVQTFGKLNILVNNAGIFPIEGVEATTLELWNRVIAINQTGVWLGMKAAVPAMRRAGGGSIVNISSIAGLMGSGMATAYHGTKGAVRILSKTAAIEYAKDGIRINSVHPGGVDTVMLDVLNSEGKRAAAAAHPLGRLATAEDIAYGVLYLASDEASFVTGTELVIDGGYTAR